MGRDGDYGDLRLEEAIAVSIDGLDCFIICDGDMIGLDSNEFAVLLVGLVDG